MYNKSTIIYRVQQSVIIDHKQFVNNFINMKMSCNTLVAITYKIGTFME